MLRRYGMSRIAIAGVSYRTSRKGAAVPKRQGGSRSEHAGPPAPAVAPSVMAGSSGRHAYAYPLSRQARPVLRMLARGSRWLE
jgi:hypothetical protein